MRILITADWQSEWTNLDRCRQVVQKIASICKQRHLTTVVVAGDLKRSYNPVDCRVMQFWLESIGFLKDRGLRVVLLLGNHDRLGLYNDNTNWLPLLQEFGAEVFWTAGWTNPDDTDETIALLPFTGTQERLDSEVEKLRATKWNPKKDVLIFHHELKDAKFNKMGSLSSDGIPISTLMPEKFKYCIGGHIHLAQIVARNVFYVGSPFATDWGEVNQKKFFCVIEGEGLHWVPTGMPGLYDPGVRGFVAPKTWKNAKVRIRVEVAKGDNYGDKLAKAKAIAETKYKGATVVVVPQFQESNLDVNPDSKLSDKEQIELYVRQAESDRPDEMLAYIGQKVRATGMGLREDAGIRFIRGWAEQFLSFDKVEINFDRGGIVVVTGRNIDWDGRSNGSGKSSLLSILPVALFGRTFKDQAANDWVQRGAKGKSLVGLEFKTAGRLVKVERTRNPTSVRLWVNDQEISAGNKSTDVAKDIERLCGFSWDMFAGTCYLDQEEVGAFLWGTPKEKQETINRLQNLERFELACQIVKKERNQVQEQWLEVNNEIDLLKERMDAQEERVTIQQGIDELRGKLVVVRKELALKSSAPKKVSIDRYVEVQKKARAVHLERTRLEIGMEALEESIKELKSMPLICPKCKQTVRRELVTKEIKEKGRQLVQREADHASVYEEDVQLERQTTEMEERIKARADEIAAFNHQRRTLLDRGAEIVKQLAWWNKKLKNLEKRDAKLEHRRLALTKYSEALKDELAFMDTAVAILSRNGLPAYLSQLIYPKLNEAAAFFSDVFSADEIQVRFDLADGLVDVQVLNVHGGEFLKDQSAGERRLAALIVSFAMRECAPKSNILILDEPAESLDPANAQAFGYGLTRMKDRFGSIFVMTHNAAMASELSGENQIVVEKQHGVSALV